jgi:hypothetical protein
MRLEGWAAFDSIWASWFETAQARLLTMRNRYGFAGWMNVHGVTSESLGTSTSIR